jgi:small GTP-binding protein
MEENNEDKNIYTYKIILIGDSFVGKTSLIIRFCDDHFSESGVATVGIDTKTKYVKRKEKKIELQIWDTAGQEKFRSLAKSCCNQMDGIVFVYDIGNKESFKSIKTWYNNLKDIVDFTKVGVVLVGNKCDIQEPEVDKNAGQELANNYSIPFIESSAKNNKNVNEIFTNLIDEMVKLDIESDGALSRSRSKVGKVMTTSTIMEGDEYIKKKKEKRNCCK